jgi:hypothetical protein
MKIVFEKDEIVSVESQNDDFMWGKIEIKVLLDEQICMFKKLQGLVFNVELRYQECTTICGNFLWTHNINEHSYFTSSGVVDLVYTGSDNSKSLNAISKIEKQLDKLRKELK